MTWNRRRFVLSVLLFVLPVSVVGGLLLDRSSDDVDVNLTDPGVEQTPGIGTNAPADGRRFTFVPVVDVATGGRVTLAAQGKPMVVNFWFANCEPCKREMPAIERSTATHAGKVEFLGINPVDTIASATRFLTDYGITFANYLDSDGAQLTEAGVVNMPTTVFLDPDGKVVHTVSGEIDEAYIDRVLRDSLGVTP